ncbi:MAG: hypothetical protein K8R17_07600 [Methanosarcinales archaeon]|nr:hypothetical protein [Methanosarcinales archaeon]
MITEIDFALEEYKTLRKEILDKMERSYKTLSLGVGGITVILGFVFEYKIYELFFVLPFLILANSYRYRAETKAIINAGSYIKKIENSVMACNVVVIWVECLFINYGKKQIQNRPEK